MQTPAPRGALRPLPTKDEELFGEGVDPRRRGRVLVIANDKAMQNVLATLTTIEGCEAMTSPQGLAALRAIRTWQPRVILLDLDNFAGDPSDTVREYREAAGDEVSIVVFATSDVEQDLVEQIGAAAALSKPFAAADLLDLLRQLAHCSG